VVQLFRQLRTRRPRRSRARSSGSGSGTRRSSPTAGRRRDLYRKVRDEELAKLGGPQQGRLREATEVLDGLVLSEEFSEFLTLPAYRYLD